MDVKVRIHCDILTSNNSPHHQVNMRAFRFVFSRTLQSSAVDIVCRLSVVSLSSSI